MTAEEYVKQIFEKIRKKILENPDKSPINIEEVMCSLCGEPIANHDH